MTHSSGSDRSSSSVVRSVTGDELPVTEVVTPASLVVTSAAVPSADCRSARPSRGGTVTFFFRASTRVQRSSCTSSAAAADAPVANDGEAPTADAEDGSEDPVTAATFFPFFFFGFFVAPTDTCCCCCCTCCSSSGGCDCDCCVSRASSTDVTVPSKPPGTTSRDGICAAGASRCCCCCCCCCGGGVCRCRSRVFDADVETDKAPGTGASRISKFLSVASPGSCSFRPRFFCPRRVEVALNAPTLVSEYASSSPDCAAGRK